MHHPTSYAALSLTDRCAMSRCCPLAASSCPTADFKAWADGQSGKKLRLEDFYLWVRRDTAS